MLPAAFNTKIVQAICLVGMLLAFLSAQAQTDSVCLPCNGHPELCKKRFNEVVYPSTHNAFNAGRAKHQRFTYPNQKYDIPTQLQDGVRGFMIDIHYYNGPCKKTKAKHEVLVFHAYAVLGYEPLQKVLKYYKDFLDTHPREVITVMCESYITKEDMESEVTKAGLLPYVLTQPKGAPWPTLQQMIDSNRRLVFFTDNVPTTIGWHHKAHEYYMENPYTNHSYRKYNCDLMGGMDTTLPLWTFNHFLTGTFARRHKNKIANSYCLLMGRAQQCMAVHHHLINFLTVDWYNKGDLFKVVDELNHVPPPPNGYRKRR